MFILLGAPNCALRAVPSHTHPRALRLILRARGHLRACTHRAEYAYVPTTRGCRDAGTCNPARAHAARQGRKRARRAHGCTPVVQKLVPPVFK
ncbi:hypothetical protein EON67_02645 [archaeon]|nr:MAG: hypothetical protein EON67_02645 [archaeon]